MNTKLFAVMVAFALSACADNSPPPQDQPAESTLAETADVKAESEVATLPAGDQQARDPVIARQAAQAQASANEAAAVAAATLNEEAIEAAIQAQARIANGSTSENPEQVSDDR